MTVTKYPTTSHSPNSLSKQIGGGSLFCVISKATGETSALCDYAKELGNGSRFCVVSKELGGGSRFCVVSKQLGGSSHICLVSWGPNFTSPAPNMSCKETKFRCIGEDMINTSVDQGPPADFVLSNRPITRVFLRLSSIRPSDSRRLGCVAARISISLPDVRYNSYRTRRICWPNRTDTLSHSTVLPRGFAHHACRLAALLHVPPINAALQSLSLS